ncbi:hypothetical protein EOL96_09110 [Candidatus Saccharibacteria bacterium]|nr:hypothetical protein [Candidatus Saccharibacteria bacterium]
MNAIVTTVKKNSVARRICIWVVIVGLLLLIPFLLNAPWTTGDYILATIVLYFCAVLYVFASAHSRNAIGWIFGILFIIIAVLNAVLVHVVPGVLYLLLSLFFLPPFTKLVKSKFNYAIPLALQVIVGLLALWGTLAVGDLAEILGL